MKNYCFSNFPLGKKIILLLAFALLPINSVFAKEVTLSVNQSEYYFLVGEEAQIPLELDNQYDKQIDSMLTYAITQEIRQAGFQYSSTNTQSKSLIVEKGKNTIWLNFGTSDTPITLKIALSLAYEDKTANLDEILIHFVSEQSQKKDNQKSKKSSSQKTNAQQNQQQNSVTEQMQQQMQQMQQQMSQIFGNQQPQNPQQTLQNNQMAQDSSALKQQMERQLQEQQKMREEFQRNLANNPEFQKQHQQLLQQGYNLASGNLNPTTNNTGDFELNYQKSGETASLKGSMENGEIKNIEKTTSEDLKKIMDELGKNEKFNKYSQKLEKRGFQEQAPDLQREGNITTVNVPYESKKNETAVIKARIKDNKIEEVTLEKEKSYWWLFFLIIIILAVLGYFIYKVYSKKEEKEEVRSIVEEPIDYRKEALKLLEEAKKLFNEKKEKDAYGKAAEAIRFYYSYKLDIKIELTNFDLIRLLKKSEISYEKTQKCLNLCGLVEFAKYTANKDDFDEIVNLAEKIII